MRFNRNQRTAAIRSIPKLRGTSRHRRLNTLEMLEGRVLLAGDTSAALWQNPYNRGDVNHDARVSPLDVLVIINDLATNGSHAVPQPGASPLTATSSSSASPSAAFLDVNGDNRVSAIDALNVINLLDTPKKLEIHTFATDMAGNAISTINVGSDFKIVTVVTDIRDPVNPHPGVYAAYENVNYDSTLTTIDSSTPIVFDPAFTITRSGSVATPGVVSQVGAARDSLSAPGTTPQLEWSVVAHASAAGMQQFNLSFDAVVGDECLLYGVAGTEDDQPVPESAISFVGGTLQISGAPQISVTSVSHAEGTSATPTPFVFTVSLSNPFDQQVTVQFATAPTGANPATSGVDYQPTSGTLTFAPNTTSQVVTVMVVADSTVESNETFNVVLTNPTNSSIANGTGLGTIVNDDVATTLAIGDATVQNVLSGTVNMVFTVSLSAAAIDPVTVDFATSDMTATANVDYTPTNGTLVFSPGTLTQLITVSVIGDPNPDVTETFQVTLTNPSGATLADGDAIGTILPAVVVPTLSVSSVTLPEGNNIATPTNFVFTASLSSQSSGTIVVGFATSDDTATAADLDYIPKVTTLTFSPGETSKLVTVQVIGDSTVEPLEMFKVTLTPISGAVTSGTLTGIGTIINDDGTAQISINDVTVGVGGTSNVDAVFTVTLSAAISQQVTLGYATADNTATKNIDYIPQSGNLTFTPGGPLTQTITVPVIGSPVTSPDETFFVNLSSLTGEAEFANSAGLGTIVRQGLVVSNPSVAEDSGDPTSPGNELFTVTLTAAQDHTVTVEYATADGTATVANNDYKATSGTLTFAAGQTTQVVTVAIVADTVQESNETFSVNLTNAAGSTIIFGTGTGTILNDDGEQAAVTINLADLSGVPFLPSKVLAVNDHFLLEVFIQDTQTDPTGVLQAYVNALYDSQLVSVVPNSIVYGPDFPDLQSGSDNGMGTLFDVGGLHTSQPDMPGTPQLLFSVELVASHVGFAQFSTDPSPVAGHEVYEAFNNVPVSTNYDSTASINIGNNVIAVNSISANEGNSGQTSFVFTVTRFLPTTGEASVPYSTSNGTATAGQDYVAQSGTLTFAVGETSKQVTVLVNGDTLDENDETFFLNLGTATGATSSSSPGVGTILNDDSPVAASVGAATANEGQNLVFTVSLNTVSGKTVMVQYATADSSSGNKATAGLDYQPTTGTLTFAPGATQATVTVHSLTDILVEQSETFQLVLSNPVNATLAAAQGQGTIVDVPPALISGFVYVDLNGDGVKENNETGIADVTITATSLTTGLSQTALTKADGSFSVVGLAPGTYKVTETQPGFYVDGRDTRFGVDSAANDSFSGITLVASQSASGFYFGEAGMRADFAAMFVNRRALFGSAVTTGEVGTSLVGTPGDVLNLQGGDVWLSFDGGWQGQHFIQATFAASQGTASMTLYDNSLHAIAVGSANSTGSQLTYNGTLGAPYFLKIAGTNPHVTLQITGGTSGAANAVASGLSMADSDSSTGAASTPSIVADDVSPAQQSSTAISPMSLFSSTTPSNSASPNAQSATDEALAEDDDWVADMLLA